MPTFAIPNEKNGSPNAEIAQLVEHNLAKVGVASSSLVFRSTKVSRNADLNFEITSKSLRHSEEITRRGTIICRSSFTKVGFFLFMWWGGHLERILGEFRKRRYTKGLKLVPTLTKIEDYERYAKRGYAE